MKTANTAAFVPDDFEVPRTLRHARFALHPLDVEHNTRDYAAWTSSFEHIKATPGFIGSAWPRPMRLEDNHDDLARHAADFLARRGFTYTVLGADDDVIGCVYIYPSKDPAHDAMVRSWVSHNHAPLDRLLYQTVRAWLAAVWPFERVNYAARPSNAESS